MSDIDAFLHSMYGNLANGAAGVSVWTGNSNSGFIPGGSGGGTSSTGGTMSNSNIFGGINDFLGRVQDFGNSPLGQVVIGGLGAFNQNRAVNNAQNAQFNATNQAIGGINTALGDFFNRAEPFRQAGLAALPGVTASAYSPFNFSEFLYSPDYSAITGRFNEEKALMDQGRNVMTNIMGTGNQNLVDPRDFVTGDVPDVFSRETSPINLSNEGMIDPLDFASGPYAAARDEGIRAIQDANIMLGKGNSGDTMRDLMKFGESLKIDQIQTAMGLRDQQFGERQAMTNQNFMQGLMGEDQRFNQNLALRGLIRGEELDVFDRIANFRAQQMGERAQMFGQGALQSDMGLNNALNTYNTLFNSQFSQNSQNFDNLMRLANLGAGVTTGLGDVAVNSAFNTGQFLTGLGNSQGAADIAQGNIFTNILEQVLTGIGSGSIDNPSGGGANGDFFENVLNSISGNSPNQAANVAQLASSGGSVQDILNAGQGMNVGSLYGNLASQFPDVSYSQYLDILRDQGYSTSGTLQRLN